MTWECGDRLDVVLDACVQDDGSTRVILRGTFPEGSRLVPAQEEGSSRNVVQTFLGCEHAVRVFHVVPDAIPVEVLRTLVSDWTGTLSDQAASDLRAVLELHESRAGRR